MAGTPPRPLDGLFVLDLGQIYQGAYAGFLLAMAGATVANGPTTGKPLRRRAAVRAGLPFGGGAFGQNPEPPGSRRGKRGRDGTALPCGAVRTNVALL